MNAERFASISSILSEMVTLRHLRVERAHRAALSDDEIDLLRLDLLAARLELERHLATGES